MSHSKVWIATHICNLLVTYFHEFRVYESTTFFHQKMFCFLLKEIQSFSNIFVLNTKILPCFERKQETFCEKNCGFVDSKFLKTCHEHVNCFKFIYLFNLKYYSILISTLLTGAIRCKI